MEAKSKSEHEVLSHFSYQFFLSLIMIITLSTLLLVVMTVVRNAQVTHSSDLIIKYLDDDKEESEAVALFEIKQLNSSGQSGYLLLKDNGDNTTSVFVDTTGSINDNQPVHLHSGSCDQPGDILFDLTSLTKGISVTKLTEKISGLKSKELAVVIHKSAEEANTYNSCGDLN